MTLPSLHESFALTYANGGEDCDDLVNVPVEVVTYRNVYENPECRGTDCKTMEEAMRSRLSFKALGKGDCRGEYITSIVRDGRFVQVDTRYDSCGGGTCFYNVPAKKVP